MSLPAHFRRQAVGFARARNAYTAGPNSARHIRIRRIPITSNILRPRADGRRIQPFRRHGGHIPRPSRCRKIRRPSRRRRTPRPSRCRKIRSPSRWRRIRRPSRRRKIRRPSRRRRTPRPSRCRNIRGPSRRHRTRRSRRCRNHPRLRHSYYIRRLRHCRNIPLPPWDSRSLPPGNRIANARCSDRTSRRRGTPRRPASTASGVGDFSYIYSLGGCCPGKDRAFGTVPVGILFYTGEPIKASTPRRQLLFSGSSTQARREGAANAPFGPLRAWPACPTRSRRSDRGL